MSHAGTKDDSGKVDMTILPASFLIETAMALTHGSDKYSRTNYLTVPGAGQRYSAALLRHFFAWVGGEDLDPDSGLHHLHCASANLAMLISVKAHGTDIGSWREPCGKPVELADAPPISKLVYERRERDRLEGRP